MRLAVLSVILCLFLGLAHGLASWISEGQTNSNRDAIIKVSQGSKHWTVVESSMYTRVDNGLTFVDVSGSSVTLKGYYAMETIKKATQKSIATKVYWVCIVSILIFSSLVAGGMSGLFEGRYEI